MSIRDAIGNQFFKDQFCVINIGGQTLLARVAEVEDSGMIDLGGGNGRGPVRTPGILTLQVVIPLVPDQNGVVGGAWVVRQPKEVSAEAAVGTPQ